MKKKQWYKHDANDWLADVDLRICDLKARGLLIDLMCMAHNSDPYGHIDIGIPYGEEGFNRELSLRVRAHHKQVEGALKTLLKRGRIAVDERGVLYINRMVRDHAYSLQQSELGAQGGNPTLKAHVKPEIEENKSKNKSKSKIAKTAYGELGTVKLTDEEYQKLLDKHTQSEVNEAIEVLDGYIASTAKKYSSHYAVLKSGSWVWQRVSEQSSKKKGTTLTTPTFTREQLERGDHWK